MLLINKEEEFNLNPIIPNIDILEFWFGFNRLKRILKKIKTLILI